MRRQDTTGVPMCDQDQSEGSASLYSIYHIIIEREYCTLQFQAYIGIFVAGADSVVTCVGVSVDIIPSMEVVTGRRVMGVVVGVFCAQMRVKVTSSSKFE